MSLILDALNRAEQERKRQDQVPDIHTVHLSPAMSLEAAARTRRRLLIAAGILLVMTAIGVGIWSMLSSTQESSRQQPQSSGIEIPVAPPQQKIPEPVPAETEAKTITAPANEVNTKAVQAQPEASADIKNLYATSEEKAPEVADIPEPVTELYTTPETESESVTTVVPADTAVMEPLPEVKIRSLDAFPNLPFFNDLPWNQKQQIPTISYSRHNYLPSSVSSVVINGATRGIGNLAPGEFIIEDIVSDGVVLRHQDKVFKLPALSGWVNM